MTETAASLQRETPTKKCAILDAGETDYVTVPRRELEQEHTFLLGRVQQLRRLLGYEPLPTGKQRRRQDSR